MEKIQLTIDYLFRALVLLPNDNALSEAKAHIKQAVHKIEEIKSKRKKRTEQSKENEQINLNKKWKNSILIGLSKPLIGIPAKNALSKIEQMIENEINSN